MSNQYRPRGSALIIAILAIAAMTTVALGVVQLVPRDFKGAQALESSLSAEGAAWSGVEHALLLLKLVASQQHGFVDISKEYVVDSAFNPLKRPYSFYSAPANQTANCIVYRSACQGFDRQLANPANQTPVTIRRVLDTTDATYYKLSVWHRRQSVGNPADLTDGLGQTRSTANINPILARDEVRRLDMRDVQVLTVKWTLMGESGQSCDISANTQAKIAWSWLKADGSTIQTPAGEIMEGSRGFSPFNGSTTEFTVNRQSNLGGNNEDGQVLSLRLLVSNKNGDDKIADCFARYSLVSQGDETADLGFDVIDVTGVSQRVQRRVRVLVNRETGKPLNILDFGLVCGTGGDNSNCANLETYR